MSGLEPCSPFSILLLRGTYLNPLDKPQDQYVHVFTEFAQRGVQLEIRE